MADDAINSKSRDTGACAVPGQSGLAAWPPVDFWDWAVLGGILAAMLYGIGSYGLYEPHEGHFAGVGREMVLGRDWVTPRLDGSAYLNKPPLFYWIIAASYTLFGIGEWSARFPQALIGWLGVFLAWNWARAVWRARAGRAAAGILGVAAGWYLFSHQLLIDELLSTLYLASLYFLWKCVTRPERAAGWIGFYATLGLSIMSKGLIGLVLPCVVLLVFAFLKKDWGALRKCRPVMGLAIIAALVAPWVILVEMRNPGFLKYVIVNEHWNRIFDRRWPPDYNASKTSPLKFLLIAAVWLAPWCFFLPQIVSFSAKNASRAAGGDRQMADAVAILSLGALLPTLLFVPVPSRLIYYSLPSLPPFAVLAAGWWTSMEGDRFRRGRLAAGIAALVVGVAIAAGGQMVGGLLKNISDLQVAPQTLDFMPGFALAIGVGLAACGALLLGRKTSAALLALCLPIAAAEAWNTAGFAAFDPVRSSKRMVAQLGPKLGPECVWISEGSLEIGSAGGTAFYLGEHAGRARFVYVMKSDSPYRRPPSFPGQEPVYLIDGNELAVLWASKEPVIYVTDFLRTSDRTDDPVRLPPAPLHKVSVEGAGHRSVYANSAARALLEK